MASYNSILRSLMAGRTSMQDLDEPAWYKKDKRRRELFGGIADTAASAVQTFANIKQQKAVQASRDLTTISSFEARLGNKLNNYKVSGDVYNEAKIIFTINILLSFLS